MLDRHLTHGGVVSKPAPVFRERTEAYLAHASPETAAQTRMRLMRQRVAAIQVSAV